MPELLDDKWISPPSDDEAELLVWRSNLLGSDLRITNFAGGNTSVKLDLTDPLTGQIETVLVVKGSGGDLGSIRREGFASLYLSKLESLKRLYRGAEHEDEMAALYPMCTFGVPGAPASIDTPLHAFLPFRHIDHLHPDWAIALAAAANGREKLAEFNARFRRKLRWIPWLRPGFELGLAMQRELEQHPECDGLILANHGLFTWGDTAESSYRSSIETIDQLGQFVREHENRVVAFGGIVDVPRRDPVRTMVELRSAMSLPAIAHFDGSNEVLEFVNSTQGPQLASKGTSCPDHFIRTRVAPMFVDRDVGKALDRYRRSYRSYYEQHAEPDSPPMRSADPAVVLVPGAGMFTFARNKREARITAEFYRNAIRVMRGATALGGGAPENYVSLPAREAFRIEYWSLEEAKLRRMPKEGPLARHVAWLDREDEQITGFLRGLGAEVSTSSPEETLLEYGGIDLALNPPASLLARVQPRWILHRSSPDHLEIARYVETLSRA